jgi:Beta propeller domain
MKKQDLKRKQKLFCRFPFLAASSVFVTLLSACGGGGGTSSAPVVVASEKDLTASQPGELLAYLRTQLKAQLKSGNSSAGGGQLQLNASVTTAPVAANASSPSASDSSAQFSGSTLQEEGVDEDDLLKTDGNMIYGLSTSAGRVVAYQRDNTGAIKQTASLSIAATTNSSGMYLLSQAKKLALIGTSSTAYSSSSPSPLPALPPASTSPAVYPNYYQSKISISLIDTSSPTALVVGKTISIDGNLIGSRVIGNVLYLASSFQAPVSLTNEAIDSLKTSDVLPTIQFDTDTPTTLLAESDCYLQVKNASTSSSITTITAIDLSTAALVRNSRCFVGGSEAIYVSEKSVYVATTRYSYASPTNAGSTNAVATAIWAYPADIKTDIHKFSIDGLNVKYKASAEVKGHLGWQQDKKSYRMSEFGDDLRIITFTGELGWNFVPTIDPSASKAAGVAPSPATLTILRETGSELKTIGALPNSKRPEPIGLPNEQIYAVRFLGSKGFVVTFRRTDPLYVLDLADATDPKTVGELKTPGFSNFLFPVGANLLLGVGQDASSTGRAQGVKIGLIDISDLANPKETATRIIGKSGSASAVDGGAHGINLYSINGVTRISLPIRVHETPDLYGGFAPTYQSLFRFEVNVASRALIDKTPVSGTPLDFSNSWNTPGLFGVLNVTNSRAVQIADHVYFFNGGSLTGTAW